MTKLANSYPFQPGDNVIITVEEHASNAIPWLGIEKLGVEIRFAPSQDGCVKIEDIEALMDDRTRIVSTASTYFCSGYAINLKELGEVCRRHNVILAVDGIQSMGRVKMRPREWNISYVAGGTHKGMLGTKGAGYVYCSKELSAILKPYSGSLQSLTNGGRPFPLRHYDEIQWQPDASRLEFSMYTFGVIETLANGVSLINELGIENVDAHIHEMEELLRSLIADLPLKVVEPPQGKPLRSAVHLLPRASIRSAGRTGPAGSQSPRYRPPGLHPHGSALLQYRRANGASRSGTEKGSGTVIRNTIIEFHILITKNTPTGIPCRRIFMTFLSSMHQPKFKLFPRQFSRVALRLFLSGLLAPGVKV